MKNDVELVTIGDELLLGYTIDTNSAYVARKLAEQGVAIGRRTSGGDTMGAIVDGCPERDSGRIRSASQ